MRRRRFISNAAAAAVATGLGGHRAQCAEPAKFDPADWLRQRRLGRLTVKTPQSGKPLQPVAARTLAEWQNERRLYEQALRELIGPWPAKRPELEARVIEKEITAKWTRYKVGYQSLPSKAANASEIRARLFVPAERSGPLPALITLHQTIPQGKDEPAGVKPTLPWLTFARYYAERGYVTLAPDAIGYGERTNGGYAQSGFEWADAQPLLANHPDLTLLGLMLYDVTRAVDYLATRPEVDPERIGVMGHSLGGILTNLVLGLESRLKVGIASCGYGLFRKDGDFPARWAASNSAYLPRLILYKSDANALPIDFLQILALAAPKPHLIQTAMGDTIWTLPAVAENPFVTAELRRIRGFYGKQAVEHFVAIEPAGGAKDRNHGWYPETQKAADELLAKVLSTRLK